MADRRLAASLAVAALVAVSVAVWVGGGGSPPAPTKAPPPTRRGPAEGVRDLPLEVALSKDPAIPWGSPIRAPSEPKERPLGPLAFVLDHGSYSLYEFDTTRRRFLGPATRLAPPTEKANLPGYPTKVSGQPPKQVTIVGSMAVVAGGADGTVVLVPFDESGLGKRQAVDLPVRELRYPGGEVRTNEGPVRNRPWIGSVSPIGDGLVLAMSWDQGTPSIAYLVDPVAKVVLADVQLPGGTAGAVHPYGRQVLIAMSENVLLLVNPDLSVARSSALPGSPDQLAVGGNTAFVSLSGRFSGDPAAPIPVRLVAVSLDDGTVSPLGDEPAGAGGPLLATPGNVWWAIPDAKVIRHIRLSDGHQTDLPSCRSPHGMAKLDDVLLVACQEGWLLEVPLDGKPYKVHDAGGRTYDVVLAGPPTDRGG